MDTGLTLEGIRSGLIFFLIFVASLCVREYARAWMVDRLGDPNPAAQGRVSLNPLVHIDLFGSVIFPLMCIFLFQSSLLIGWGKPVIPNPSYFHNPRRGEVLTALAGPVANLLFALLATIVFGVAYRFDPNLAALYSEFLSVSLLLAVLNLVPLPPLDGGVLLKHLVRMSDETFYKISRWSMLLWLLIIMIPYTQMMLVFAMRVFAVPFRLLFLLLSSS